MCRVIAFRVPRNFQFKRNILQPGQTAKVLNFKRPLKKFPPDDWRILGLVVSDSTHFDAPYLR
jgi:hypothetical protein